MDGRDIRSVFLKLTPLLLKLEKNRDILDAENQTFTRQSETFDPDGPYAVSIDTDVVIVQLNSHM